MKPIYYISKHYRTLEGEVGDYARHLVEIGDAVWNEQLIVEEPVKESCKSEDLKKRKWSPHKWRGK